jgi:cephalosporin hydroxylase
MELKINTSEQSVSITEDGRQVTHPLYSVEAFSAISALWIKVGWALKYPYSFSWMGRPMIQLPEDVLRIQEIIYKLRPDFVVETGVAHGGSLILYASLFEAMHHGHVIGIDIEIKAYNRRAIEDHELSKRITLVEGSSTAPEIVSTVHGLVGTGKKVLVILDSNHSKQHVTDELEAYADLVSPGSFIVATDGVMQSLHDVPRGHPGWKSDNPSAAAAEFAKRRSDFALEEPSFPFNESLGIKERITHWPGAFLRRI